MFVLLFKWNHATSYSPIFMFIFASQLTNRTMSMVDHSFRKNILFVHVWLLLFIGVFSSCRPSEPEAGQGYSAGTESPAITSRLKKKTRLPKPTAATAVVPSWLTIMMSMRPSRENIMDCSETGRASRHNRVMNSRSVVCFKIACQ